MIQEILPEHSNYKSVYCDIVHRCNMECANCYLPNRDLPDLDTNKVVDFIRRFKNITEFRFIGGEPTLHKDLDIIIREATKMGHRTTIATNGLKISNKTYLQKLKNSGLKTVYLSMTGFDEDSIYEITDKLKCAKKKMAAFYNCLDLKLRLSIGVIVIKDLNEHIIDKIKSVLEKTNCRAGTSVEFRNIGQVGRYMKDKNDNYKFDELKNLIFKKFEFTPKSTHVLENNQYSYAFKFNKFRINITNWEGVDQGFNDTTNSIRGRLTPNYTVAPFLEHIKQNENGY
jgi:molybdenum cofactor biosynthesis enzyme MoaA